MTKETNIEKAISFRYRVVAMFVFILLVLSMLSISVSNGYQMDVKNINLEAGEPEGGGNDALGANGTNPPIHLEYGWNLVSFPYDVIDTNLAAVLSSIDGQYDSVQSYISSDAQDP